MLYDLELIILRNVSAIFLFKTVINKTLLSMLCNVHLKMNRLGNVPSLQILPDVNLYCLLR